MFDTHYDLLSIAYTAYLSGDYSYLEEVAGYFNDNNVTGVFANLYFMTPEKMKEELHEDYYQDNVSVFEMFTKAKALLDEYLPETDIVYSIEGADYITGPEELEELHKAGLNSLVLCWNTQSDYASGNRGEIGLTKLGRQLLDKAVDLGISIDLSHANKKTFDDVIEFIKEKQNEGKTVHVLASHSNSRFLCNRDRNLTDEQLHKIKEVGGYVGVFAHKNFVVGKVGDRSDENSRGMYIDHIKRIAKIVGSDHVMVATDDMNFAKPHEEYNGLNIYPYGELRKLLIADLTKGGFSVEDINSILYDNPNRLISSIREKKNQK